VKTGKPGPWCDCAMVLLPWCCDALALFALALLPWCCLLWHCCPGAACPGAACSGAAQDKPPPLDIHPTTNTRTLRRSGSFVPDMADGLNAVMGGENVVNVGVGRGRGLELAVDLDSPGRLSSGVVNMGDMDTPKCVRLGVKRRDSGGSANNNSSNNYLGCSQESVESGALEGVMGGGGDYSNFSDCNEDGGSVGSGEGGMVRGLFSGGGGGGSSANQ